MKQFEESQIHDKDQVKPIGPFEAGTSMLLAADARGRAGWRGFPSPA